MNMYPGIFPYMTLKQMRNLVKAVFDVTNWLLSTGLDES